MSKKDYILIAAALKDALPLPNSNETADYLDGQTRGVNNAAINVAAELARDNPRFDRDLFLTACGVAP